MLVPFVVVSLLFDALQQNGSWFVIWILRDEFAAESFVEG
jgi:hypothetical protein